MANSVRPVWSGKTDQPLHQLDMARVLIYPSLDSLEAVEGIVLDKRVSSKYFSYFSTKTYVVGTH